MYFLSILILYTYDKSVTLNWVMFVGVLIPRLHLHTSAGLGMEANVAI